MANERDAFLREIEEEVRRERLWDKYGVAVLGGLAAIVLLVGGWKWYQAHQISVAAQAGAQFAEVSALLEDGKKEDAVRGFEQIAKEGTYGYGQLARLRLAAQARKDGRPTLHYATTRNSPRILALMNCCADSRSSRLRR